MRKTGYCSSEKLQRFYWSMNQKRLKTTSLKQNIAFHCWSLFTNGWIINRLYGNMSVSRLKYNIPVVFTFTPLGQSRQKLHVQFWWRTLLESSSLTDRKGNGMITLRWILEREVVWYMRLTHERVQWRNLVLAVLTYCNQTWSSWSPTDLTRKKNITVIIVALNR